VTKDVTLAVENLGTAADPWGNTRIAFAARGSIDRKEFGLGWNQVLEAGGFLVGDKVELSLDVQAVRAAAQVAA
jgi:polyisoprenoid-binding protein YceI